MALGDVGVVLIAAKDLLFTIRGDREITCL